MEVTLLCNLAMCGLKQLEMGMAEERKMDKARREKLADECVGYCDAAIAYVVYD